MENVETKYEYDSMHCDDEYADEIQALNVSSAS
jgi:hypothetical protein